MLHFGELLSVVTALNNYMARHLVITMESIFVLKWHKIIVNSIESAETSLLIFTHQVVYFA